MCRNAGRQRSGELEARQGTVTQQEAQELARKLAWMKETEMAVVISQEQNEVQTFKKVGVGYSAAPCQNGKAGAG